MLELVSRVELFLCWVVWLLAFVKPRNDAAGQKEDAAGYGGVLDLVADVCGGGDSHFWPPPRFRYGRRPNEAT